MDFDPFCVSVFQGSLLVIVIMIDGSEKHFRHLYPVLDGFRLFASGCRCF